MKNWRSTILLVLLCLGVLLPVEVAEAVFSNLPSGFSDVSAMTGVPSPTAIGWLPNGTLLATGKAGQVYRANGVGGSSPILDLTSSICSGGEMGLLGLAVDPAFATSRPFVYLYYTHKRGSGCNDASDRANRVSRFTMSGNSLIPTSERVLIDNVPAKGGNHNGGDLQFGHDGLLYVSVGDSGQDLNGGNGQNGNARRMDLLNGKILRITPGGGIPSDNPFVGTNSTTCAVNGQARSAKAGVSAEKKGHKNKKARKRKQRKQRRNRRNQNPPSSLICGEIFATGLRNPYRIAFDPDDTSGTQRLFINDVGQATWEEVDDAFAGADYGWNLREGPCVEGSTSNCAPDPRFVNPVYAYEHIDGCNVITGGAFVPTGGNWPTEDKSQYLFADLGCNKLFALDQDNPSGGAAPLFTGPAGKGPSHLAFGPDGKLYYTDLSGNEVRRIDYVGP